MVDAGRAVDDSVCNGWITEAAGGNYENKRNGAGVQCKLRLTEIANEGNFQGVAEPSTLQGWRWSCRATSASKNFYRR